MLDEFRRAEAEFIRTRATDAKHDQAGGLLIEMKPVPESLSAIAGDVLQDLRSALDHEVHRMAAAVKGQDWPSLSKCAFPLHRDDQDVTRYHQQSGRKGSSLAEDEALEENVISAARAQFELAHPNVYVSVQPFFRTGSLSPKNVLVVADRLASLVPQVMPPEPTETERMTDRRATWEELERAGLGDALVRLFVTRLLARHAVMQGNDWGGSAGIMSTDTAHLESVMRQKELDLPRYRRDADAFWLMIYAPRGQPSGFFDLEALTPAMWRSTFVRVVFLDILFGRYVPIA